MQEGLAEGNQRLIFHEQNEETFEGKVSMLVHINVTLSVLNL